jgi:hypothetical protein
MGMGRGARRGVGYEIEQAAAWRLAYVAHSSFSNRAAAMH